MSWKDRAVLITGGTGFVGGRIAERLAQAGARVRTIVRRLDDFPWLAEVEKVQGDFVEPETASRACEGQEIVIHAAASIGGDAEDARRVNARGTAEMAAAARAAGCRRFLHVSTISVYDWEAARAAREGQPDLGLQAEFDETTPLKAENRAFPHSPAATPWYGISKAEAERALEQEIAAGLPATTFRLGAVLGVHPGSYWAVKVPSSIRAGKVPLVGGGLGPLPWTHVENVALAVDLAVDHPEAIGRAYNVVDGHVTMRRYVEQVRSWFPDALPAPVVEAPPSCTFAERCSNERIRRELGYSPVRTYEQGMAEAEAWWRARE